jgi:UDP-N-acetylmuramate--alanine ligase
MSGRTHFIGIGGIGMSALAQILLARGAAVSGSDARGSPITDHLVARGAELAIGHRAELVEGAARVVASDAVPQDNPERRRAEQLGLSVERRSELLAELMAGHRSIAISGTHGKTTVTAMVGLILAEADLDPTVVLGGEYGAFGGNARIGSGEWFVAEACEAYESFLDLHPDVAVVTNIEPDHLDHHKTAEHLRDSFLRFLGRVPAEGAVVLCADRPELASIPLSGRRQVVRYGTDPSAEVHGLNLEVGGAGRCDLVVRGEHAGELRVPVPGRHNVVNGLGAVAAALCAGVRPSASAAALASFCGVARRFEVMGEAGGVTVVDDYAHHPTEVAATIEAARGAFPRRRVVAVFQPHLYSRTRDFAGEFAAALAKADRAVVTDIYPAREAPLPGVTSALIAGPLRSLLGEDAVHEMAKQEVTARLCGEVRPGDVVLTMGAGDIGMVARQLLRCLGGGTTPVQQAAAKQ